MSRPDVTQTDLTYYLQAHAALKSEIQDSVAEGRATEKHTLVVAAAVFTYLAGRCGKLTPDWAWWIPCGVVLLGLSRFLALYSSIKVRSTYLGKLELEAIDPHPVQPWEIFFSTERKYWVGASMAVYWVAVLIASLLLPCWLRYWLCKT